MRGCEMRKERIEGRVGIEGGKKERRNEDNGKGRREETGGMVGLLRCFGLCVRY